MKFLEKGKVKERESEWYSVYSDIIDIISYSNK